MLFGCVWTADLSHLPTYAHHFSPGKWREHSELESSLQGERHANK